MKTKLVKKIANEAFFQLQIYKSLNLAHKKINKTLQIIISTLTVCLVAIHVYYYLKF